MDFLNKPTTDFAAVRDGRNSLPLWLDIDLTGARSIAAGSALSINIAGNSFYVDQDTANVGNATVHFQDTNLGASSAPLFVSAGFIANVPFTQILIENTAQAGKRLRIFYGVDINFQAGINASIAISGTVIVASTLQNPVNVAPSANAAGASFKANTQLVANTPETIFTAGANVNGAIVTAIGFKSNLATQGITAIVAKATAPATVVDGNVVMGPQTALGTINMGFLPAAIKIPAGQGLYFITDTNEAAGGNLRYCLYTLL